MAKVQEESPEGLGLALLPNSIGTRMHKAARGGLGGGGVQRAKALISAVGTLSGVTKADRIWDFSGRPPWSQAAGSDQKRGREGVVKPLNLLTGCRPQTLCKPKLLSPSVEALRGGVLGPQG